MMAKSRTCAKNFVLNLQDVHVLRLCFFFLQGIFHNFNVFRIREKQIPVDIVEVKGKSQI